MRRKHQVIAMNFQIHASYALQSKLDQVIIHQSLLLCLTIKTGEMFKSRVACLVFSLKMTMGGSVCPSAVADKITVRCFFHSLRNEPHKLSPFFKIHFDATIAVNENTGVSSRMHSGSHETWGIFTEFAKNTFQLEGT